MIPEKKSNKPVEEKIDEKVIGEAELQDENVVSEEFDNSNDSESRVKTTEEPTKVKTFKKADENASNINTAIVFNGKNEVRRFTFDIHGKNFDKLAEEFATNRNFGVEYKNMKPGIVCSSCGHINYSE